MALAKARASGLALDALAGLVSLGGALACGSEGGAAAPEQVASAARREGYEGMNFYETNADQAPSIGSVPLGGVPGSYGLVTGEDPLPVCSAGIGERPTASPSEAALACPPVTRELISDFTFTGNPSNVTFGGDAAVPGGTFHYPDAPDALRSDVTDGDWHIYGTVRSISGFGLYFSGCHQIDAAAYRGVAFELWGQIGDGGGLVFFVGTAENQVASSWVNENKASPSEPDEPVNRGRCVPLSSRYDGTCREARRVASVPEAPERVIVLWRDLGEGCPDPSVNPSEITTIAWYFPQPIRGPYEVDIHIDDLRFTDEGPL